jgi:hypothetical protein
MKVIYADDADVDFSNQLPIKKKKKLDAEQEVAFSSSCICVDFNDETIWKMRRPAGHQNKNRLLGGKTETENKQRISLFQCLLQDLRSWQM